ncbi:hypothetical protein SLEP1_g58523 [Rubroshorea leprosula]|uniref:Uncharacterized protein n=1 Tax=Rubroshorea leprosula TaxID=152421 RepID=A0AAV5MQ04_9ROSI|nr:hypothetical protein SLEP1_g58523 [Rubroshorea leprosula]
MPNSGMESSVSSKFLLSNVQVPSPTMDTTSLNSAQAAEYEDAESGAFVFASMSKYILSGAFVFPLF